MVGPKFAEEILDKLGAPNSYYFEITKADGTVSPNGSEGIDIAEPPVKVQIDFVTDFTNDDLREEITRYCLMNRVVKIFCAKKKKVISKDKDDKDIITYEELEPIEVGSIVINQLNISWDMLPVFKQHPLSLKGLIDICTSQILGNLLPSQN